MRKLKMLAPLCILMIMNNSTYASTSAQKNNTNKHYKPSAPVEVISPESVRLGSTSSKDFDIKFEAPKKGKLKISVQANQGIALQDPNRIWNFDLSEELPEIRITVESENEGRYNIMFFAEYTYNNAQTARVFGLPVYVGQSSLSTQKSADIAAPEFIVLPAEEEIITN